MHSWMIILFSSLLGIDEMIKQQVEENIDKGEEREFAGGKVIIRKVYNRGLLLNLLEGHPKMVRRATIGAGIGILVWDLLTFIPVRMYRSLSTAGHIGIHNSGRRAGSIRICVKKGQYIRKFAMILLSAGAASNIFDRLVRGKVIDYIGIRTGKKFLDRITANLGDLYIVCGGGLLMIRNIFSNYLHI